MVVVIRASLEFALPFVKRRILLCSPMPKAFLRMASSSLSQPQRIMASLQMATWQLVRLLRCNMIQLSSKKEYIRPIMMKRREDIQQLPWIIIEVDNKFL